MLNHNFLLGPTDTDSISFCKPDMKLITKEERIVLLNELRSISPDYMDWEDDGYYKRCIIVGAKNYIMQDEAGKVTIKGSGLKASMKERALQAFIQELIDLLLKDKKDQILFHYLKYVHTILNLKDITDWCSKKTITKAVLNPERTQEERISAALKGSDYKEGDKAYMFFKTETELCLREKFDGAYDKDILLGKLHDTLSIFGTVIDADLFPNFTLKKNQSMLTDLGYVPKFEPIKSAKTITAQDAAREIMNENRETLQKLGAG